MGITDHLSYLLRNLYAGQEATVRIRHGKTDWFKTEKGVRQGYIYCDPAECKVDDSQAGIQIAERNVNNPRNTDDTALMAESKEKLKSLLMSGKEESEKVSLKLSMQKLRSWHLVPTLYGE